MRTFARLLEPFLQCGLILATACVAWALQMVSAEKLAFVYGHGFGGTLALFVSYCVPLAFGLKLVLEKVHTYFSRFR
jgi:hypothetical protein